MSKLNTYTIKGTKKKSGVELPKEMSEDINMRLLAQAIRVYEDRRHPGLSQTKTRSEVVASKRKIYRQKGTGRARHGEISAPIFVGGGKAHGPTGLKRELSMPKKMRDKAFKIAMSLKAKEGRLLVAEGLSGIKKTKDAAEMLNKIIKTEKIKPDSQFLFALSQKNKDSVLYLRNLKNVNTVPFSSLNAYNTFFSKVVVVDKEALEEKKENGNSSKKATKKTNKAKSQKNTNSSGSKSKSTRKSKTSKKGKEKSA